MSFKIAFIGAGSLIFARTLFTDMDPLTGAVRVQDKTVEEVAAEKESRKITV